jgi:aryl carrier-like protein
VTQAVVELRESTAGQPHLVAYVVNGRGETPTQEDLSRHLRRTVPEYMVPAVFVMLDHLPLNANGKVNRRALPAPLLPEASSSASHLFVNETERALASIWCAVLGLAAVGRSQNFFELGGDSILSIQLVARARQAGFTLTARQLFEFPTVAELAAAVGQARSTTALAQGPETVSGEVALTPIQRWFFTQEFAEPWHWNQAVMVRAAEPLKGRALDAAVAELVAHHDALRLRFTQAEDGTWRQHNEAATGHDSSSGGIATGHDSADGLVLRVDLSALADAQQSEVQSRVAGEVQRSLHLETGPLVRVAVFIRSDSERVLVVTHH